MYGNEIANEICTFHLSPGIELDGWEEFNGKPANQPCARA